MKRPRPALAALWVLCAVLVCSGAWTALNAASPAHATVKSDASEASVAAPPASAQAPQSGPQATIRVPTGSLGTPLLPRLRSVLGLAVLLLIAWLMSTDRRRVPWRVVIWGTTLQILFALFILKTPVGAGFFDGAFDKVLCQTTRGSFEVDATMAAQRSTPPG